MALINLQSDLKKLTFGEFGVEEPLVIKPIDGSASTSGIELQGSKRVDDLKRITKLLTQTPSALKFAANLTALNKIQNDIQSPDKTFVGNALRGARDSAKIIASTLAQVPVSGTGTHFVTGFSGKKGYLEGVRGHLDYKNRIPNGLYDSGSNNIPTRGKIEDSEDISKRGKILDTYVNKFTQTLGTNFIPDTLSVIATPSGSINSDEQRNKIKKGKQYTLLYAPRTEERKVTTVYNRDDQGFETDTKLATTSGSTQAHAVVDLFTAYRPITGSTESAPGIFTPQSADGMYLYNHKDLIDFNFKIIEPIIANEGSPSVTYLPFRAYLDSFNDSYTGEWNAHKYIGRAEDFYTYGGFGRDIQFSFKVAASSKAEMVPLYEKLNSLVGSTAPSYVGSGFMRGQFVAVTVGDYLVNQTGFISSIGFTWTTDYIWHSEGMNIHGEEENEDAQAGQESAKSKNLPTVLDVSVSFTPIHTSTPKYGSEFIGKENKIFYPKY